MKKSILTGRVFGALLICMLGIQSLYAVPAYPGWQTKTMSDGSTVQVRLTGDEFYSYWETQDGKIALEQPNGTFLMTNEAVPSREVERARRAAARQGRADVSEAVRAPKTAGSQPNLAPRGVVILVNYSNSEMASGHTLSVFDDMCNATNCTTNSYNGKNYGSAAQYFADQSNGSYRPVFDVFGPVNLSNTVKYYGEDGELNGKMEKDIYLADFVIDAVLAAEEAGCDFSQYDSDNDGWVDFIYFIFAGKGQAYGGSSETIWPHNWTLVSALYYGFTHGTSGYYFKDGSDYNLPRLDGKYINNYACSAELDGYNQLGGIGTLCHEFGHVMGLPDFYDTEYGEISQSGVTPGKWNIMDGGSYNGGMHCPPNYDPWEKYFFGWVDPVNPGNKGADVTLYANGTADYNTYQINEAGSQQVATKQGVNYYLENRQKNGWDEFLPGHGLAIWRVDFDADIWKKNAPNNSSTENTPRYTVELVESSSWEAVSGKPVTKIKETNGLITFQYKDGASEPVDPLGEGWAYYDDGTFATSIGAGGTIYWGVMFPGNTFACDKVTKVAIFETTQNNTQPITFTISSGGDTPPSATSLYSQTVNPTGLDGFHEITLESPVSFDKSQNLWVTLTASTDIYPACASADSGDPNGRWVSVDGVNWMDLADAGLNYTFMVRVYVENGSGLTSVEATESVPQENKILRDGQILIRREGTVYTVLGQPVAY